MQEELKERMLRSYGQLDGAQTLQFGVDTLVAVGRNRLYTALASLVYMLSFLVIIVSIIVLDSFIDSLDYPWYANISIIFLSFIAWVMIGNGNHFKKE